MDIACSSLDNDIKKCLSRLIHGEWRDEATFELYEVARGLLYAWELGHYYCRYEAKCDEVFDDGYNGPMTYTSLRSDQDEGN